MTTTRVAHDRNARLPSLPSNRGEGQRQSVNQAIRECFPDRSLHRDKFLNFLAIIQSRSNLMDFHSHRAIPNCFQHKAVIEQLRVIFGLLHKAMRPIEAWEPPARVSIVQQYQSLLLHLFVKYDVPSYLTSSTFTLDLHALIWIGRGKSVRSAFQTVKLSKTLVRALWHVPEDLCSTGALLWAQVVAWGGSEKLARQVCETWWLWLPAKDSLSKSVTKFLIRCEMDAKRKPMDCPSFGKDEVGDLIKFVHEVTCLPPHRLLGYQAESDDPLKPDLCLDGKGLRWMRRLMANWKHMIELPNPKHGHKVNHFTWQHSKIGDFKWHDGDNEWSIHELCSTHFLNREGWAMQHCVAVYDRDCFERDTTIWSVRRHCVEGRSKIVKRMATIEVLPRDQSIVQVRGKFNQRPNERAIACLRAWASEQNLSLSEDCLDD